MNVSQFVDRVVFNVLEPLVALLIGLAVLVFLAGLVRFLSNSTNPEERKRGARHMLWGFVGFIIMFSVNGILAYIESSVLPQEELNTAR